MSGQPNDHQQQHQTGHVNDPRYYGYPTNSGNPAPQQPGVQPRPAYYPNQPAHLGHIPPQQVVQHFQHDTAALLAAMRTQGLEPQRYAPPSNQTVTRQQILPRQAIQPYPPSSTEVQARQEAVRQYGSAPHLGPQAYTSQSHGRAESQPKTGTQSTNDFAKANFAKYMKAKQTNPKQPGQETAGYERVDRPLTTNQVNQMALAEHARYLESQQAQGLAHPGVQGLKRSLEQDLPLVPQKKQQQLPEQTGSQQPELDSHVYKGKEPAYANPAHGNFGTLTPAPPAPSRSFRPHQGQSVTRSFGFTTADAAYTVSQREDSERKPFTVFDFRGTFYAVLPKDGADVVPITEARGYLVLSDTCGQVIEYGTLKRHKETDLHKNQCIAKHGYTEQGKKFQADGKMVWLKPIDTSKSIKLNKQGVVE